ncbi:MAG TPA: hypothetical protein VE439_09110 [Anaerolineae bacterium]|jgi:hypothetical protein|nr:hypothetical protein [Anaerolineae bacterium]
MAKNLSKRAKFIIGVPIGAIFAGVLVLPFLLMLVPNPNPVKITSLANQRVGTYLDTGRGLYKLYPYSSSQANFPEGAPAAIEQPCVYIKYRQLDGLSSYGIYEYSSSQPVPVRKTIKSKSILQILPRGRLAPGLYYVTAARNGMFGGKDYFYFKVGSKDSKNTLLISRGSGYMLFL